MSERHCSVCLKDIPEGILGNKCSLCSIGLTPSSTGNPEVGLKSASNNSTPVFAQQQQASDSLAPVQDGRCGTCGIEISATDLRRGSCSFCSASVAAKKTPDQELVSAGVFSKPGEYTLGETEWPSEARII